MKSRAKTTLRSPHPWCALFREFSASVAFIVAGAIVPMTRRRAVAAAGAVLRRLRGGYGCAAIEAPWVMTRTTRPPSPCHAPWTRRGVASSPSALSPDPAPAVEAETRSPSAATGADGGDSARFARWTRRRARALRVSPAKRWRLTAEEQAEDRVIATSILREARARGRVRPLATRASARRRGGRRARVRRAHHAGVAPGRGLALRNGGGRARRRGALPRASARVVPRHLERDVDLVRCMDAFRHAGVWDVASDAKKALRAHAEDAEDAGDASRRDEHLERLERGLDPARALEALGADGGAAYARVRARAGWVARAARTTGARALATPRRVCTTRRHGAGPRAGRRRCVRT